jgi:hypothetical protein
MNRRKSVIPTTQGISTSTISNNGPEALHTIVYNDELRVRLCVLRDAVQLRETGIPSRQGDDEPTVQILDPDRRTRRFSRNLGRPSYAGGRALSERMCESRVRKMRTFSPSRPK